MANIDRFDLNLLVVFDAVASCKSVSRAAERLSLSQPAISHALNRLRDQLQDPLFVRGRRGFLPTPRAEMMIDAVRDILSAAGGILSVQDFDPETSERRFCVGASDYASLTIVPALVKELRIRARHVTLDTVSLGKATLDQIEAGEIDCAFYGAFRSEPPWRSSKLFLERLVGMVAPDHPLAKNADRQPITLVEYLAYPHVVASLKDPNKNQIDAALNDVGRSRKIAVRTESFAANMALLAGTDLIASLPSRLAPRARGKHLVIFELPLTLSEYEYSLVWHTRMDADPAFKWLQLLMDQIASTSLETPPDLAERRKLRAG